MNGIQGFGSILGLAEEVTYGSAVTPPTHWLPCTKIGLQLMPKLEALPHLFPAGVAPTNNIQRDFGVLGIDAGGSIEFIPCYDHKPTLMMFAYMLGAAAVTTGAGPYVHTHNFACPGTLKGLTMHQIMGSHQSVTDLGRTFSGSVVAGFEISCKARQPLMVKCDVIARVGADPGAVSGTPTFAASEEIMASHVSAASWNSRTDLTATDWTIKGNKGLVRTPFIGSQYTGQPNPGGWTEITLGAKIYATKTDMLADFAAQDQDDFVITHTGSGSNALVLTMHNAVMRKCEIAFDGPGFRIYDTEWQAFNTTAESGLKAVFTNTNAAAV